MNRPTSDRKVMRLLRDRNGASTVEFGLILTVLVVLSLGIIDFSLLMFDFARATEATRRGARLAAISEPVGNLDGLAAGDVECKTSSGTPSCTGGALINSGVFNAVVTKIQEIYPAIQAENIVITYSASGIGTAQSGGYKPYVKVSLSAFQRPFYALQAVTGLTPTLTMPPFATTHLGNPYAPVA